MKRLFYLLCFFCIAVASQSQSMERKIVIRKGLFYYATIDPEFQMGTLHTGSILIPVKKEKRLAMPAGRNYHDPINPFCWDVQNENCYAVNSLMHPMNDQNEALKRFPLASLQEWGEKVTMQDMLNKSVDQNNFTSNIPYSFVTGRSKILSNFFYDAVALNDSVFYMAVVNNNEFSFWRYNGTAWDHVEKSNFTITAPFSLFCVKQDVYMILNTGKVYALTMRSIIEIPEKSQNIDLSTGVLIINKDDHTVKFLKETQLPENTSVNEIVKKKAINIF